MTWSPVMATEIGYLDTLNAGAETILSGELVEDNGGDGATNLEKDGSEEETEEAETEKSDLVMANVNDAVNVRQEPDEDSEKSGKLYKDCGGMMLEQADGWTKIQSGDLVGWVKDEYLLFGDEAETLAADVGRLTATVTTDALRVRKEASNDAGIYGLLAKGDTIEALEEDGDWVLVSYEGDTGYVSAEYVTVEFELDTGETMETIKEREEEEAAEKAKLSSNQGAVAVGTTDTELLASLIQCEAGSQSYDGQLAVGAVVMNRVRSGGYPSTVQGVIYASGQFPPALNGKVAQVVARGASSSCVQAAQQAIAGATNVGTATHFRGTGSHEGIVIGGHVFW